jgi:hypothetical protein
MFGITTTRRLRDELDKQQRGFQAEMKQAAQHGSSARQILARELSELKDEVALHIVAAEHPSSALSDARSMALSLREAVESRGIDLRIELGRLEGGDL